MSRTPSQPPASSIDVFDRTLLRRRRDRAARTIGEFDFLLQAVASRLMERLALVKKEFPLVLDLGAGNGALTEKLKNRAGTQTVIKTDMSAGMAALGTDAAVVADEDFLPFKDQSLDAVVSNLSLHWVNDLPGALLQVQRALKPDGLFMAAVLGGETLRELRDVMMQAELNVTGGASPRVSPFIDMRDMGALMQRAGFGLPVVDNEIITVDYSHPLTLMRDLRGMGAANATHNRLKKLTRRDVLFEAAHLYQGQYGGEGGLMPATFEIIYAIGWRPHDSQQKPLKPGSATARLADQLSAIETKL